MASSNGEAASSAINLLAAATACLKRAGCAPVNSVVAAAACSALGLVGRTPSPGSLPPVLEHARPTASDSPDQLAGAKGRARDFVTIANRTSTTALSLKVFMKTSHHRMPNLIIMPDQADDLVAGPATQPLRSRVQVGDPPIGVHRHHGLTDGCEKARLELE